uniref:Uncharacterized protein n=2 Tax=Caenorhabditis japonica TaxID=281687 RepID=A0A8R1EGK6_CAEJA
MSGAIFDIISQSFWLTNQSILQVFLEFSTIPHFQICMWLFMLLYLFAFWVISRLKRKTEREALYAGEEDYLVYRVSVWISSTAVGTSLGSLTLLPFSVIGVELLQLYDGNYYLQWLSYSLIGALWHYVFMLCNLSLFVLLPFSYFFIESQGFSAHKGGNVSFWSENVMDLANSHQLEEEEEMMKGEGDKVHSH